MSKIIIYKLEKNNIPFYVGYTSNKKRRLYTHKNKYGNDIEMIQIDETEDYNKKITENWWIDKLRNDGFILLNKNNGGGGSIAGSRTEESLNKFKETFKSNPWNRKGTPQPYSYTIKIKEALSGVSKPEGFGDNLSINRKGVSKPDGYGEKVSLKRKGTHNFNGTRPVFQMDDYGNIINEFYSIIEAADITHSNSASISKVCRGKLIHTNGFRWVFKEIDYNYRICSRCGINKNIKEFASIEKSWCRQCLGDYNQEYYSLIWNTKQSNK